jgi:hypothetical protein
MSFLGNTPTTQSFTSLTERFNGDGSTTTITLSRAVYNASDIEVIVNNVQQDPYDAYTVNGTQTLTFTEAPSVGTGNIIVTYRNYTISKFVPGEGTVTASAIADGSITGVKLASATITGDKIGLTAITGNLIAAAAITGDKIGLTAITGNLIAAAAITGDKIAAATIGSSNLVTTGVSAGNYGSASNIPVITVGTDGRVTYAANVATATVDVNNITGNVNISGNVKAQTYQETFSNVSIASGNITCNLASATIFKTVVTSAANVIFTSPPPNLTGFSFLIQLSQTGSYALTWPASIQWPLNTAPTLSTTAGYVDTIALYTIDGGSNYYATSVLSQF